MTTASLNLPLHLMPADAARVRTVGGSGERIVAAGIALAHGLQHVWSLIGEGRARLELRELAREQQTERPELAAALRRAAVNSWMA